MTDRKLFEVKPDPLGLRWTPFPGPGVELWGCGPEGAECGDCKHFEDLFLPACALVADETDRNEVTRAGHAACKWFVRKERNPCRT